MIFLKSREEIEIMRIANSVVCEILEELRSNIRAGMSTGEIDKLAEEMIRKKRVRSAFKGYQMRNGTVPFPATICVSLNDEVVHGIPSSHRLLQDGDIVSLDFGIIYENFYGDAALTFMLGQGNDIARRLIDTTAGALEAGIAEAQVGNRLGNVSSAIQEWIEKEGFSVVREFVGHGVGRKLHEDPAVPNYGKRDRGVRLREGLVIAIEPMVNAGKADVMLKSDGWTAVTKDGSVSAHFEHSVAITERGPMVLSRV